MVYGQGRRDGDCGEDMTTARMWCPPLRGRLGNPWRLKRGGHHIRAVVMSSPPEPYVTPQARRADRYAASGCTPSMRSNSSRISARSMYDIASAYPWL